MFIGEKNKTLKTDRKKLLQYTEIVYLKERNLSLYINITIRL